MKSLSKFLSLLGAAISLAIAFFTATGKIQKYIVFESPENEMGFAFVLICIAFILSASVFARRKEYI